jgi:cystathionine beta-lyase
MEAEFDFDKIISRRHTGSLKWDYYSDPNVIPLWVADMDFQSPRVVIEALRRHLEQGVFGYPQPARQLVNTVVSMLKYRYNWTIEPEWLVWLPGLGAGLNLACRSVGVDEDEVITFTPVYPPFLSAPGNSGRRLVKAPLTHKSGRWNFDLKELEQKLTSRSRLLLLCSPHNPVGRVFTRGELLSLAEFCVGHNLVICSDEVHCDLIFDNRGHTPTASLNERIAKNTITLMSPSKTYNLAGLNCSFAVIADEEIRKRFLQAHKGLVSLPSVPGLTACQAAYRAGEPWRLALLEYLRENRDLVFHTINHEIPRLSMDRVEATFLAWIDARELEVSNPGDFFLKAGVALYDGRHFDGPGYVRLNFACPRALLSEALNRMKFAVKELVENQ